MSLMNTQILSQHNMHTYTHTHTHIYIYIYIHKTYAQCMNTCFSYVQASLPLPHAIQGRAQDELPRHNASPEDLESFSFIGGREFLPGR